MLLLHKSFARSKMEYCCPLWHTRKINDIQMIETVQRTFTTRISGMEGLNYWQRLKKLNLLSLQRRRERFSIFYMWKIIYGNDLNNLNFQFRYSERRGLTVLIDPIQNSNAKAPALYDCSFAVMGPQLWNKLPANISMISCFSSFKMEVDKFLSTLPDKPPIQGYPYTNDNSIISI